MSDPIFKACTRPAMLFSVPLVPFLASNSLIILIGMWANYLGLGMWVLLFLVPNYAGMRIVTQFDDSMFSLLWLKFLCRRRNVNRGFYKKTVYSPLSFKQRK